MINKRFEYLEFDDGTEGVYDTEKEEYFFGFDDVVDLLNNLVEEYEFDYLHANCRCIMLSEERLLSKLNLLEKENQHLKKENERKTNEIKLLRKAYSKIPKGIREVWKE